MLGKQNSKEGTPDNLHKVVYSQIKSDAQTLSMAPGVCIIWILSPSMEWTLYDGIQLYYAIL